MTNAPSPFITLTDAQLIVEVKRLAASERRATAELIRSLVEFDARRLYLGEGYSSLFSFCTQALRLSEHAAYGRIEAARAARKFPVILDLLQHGDLNLTAVGLLAPHLTDENHAALLASARGKHKREVEGLVAALRPQVSVPASVVRPVTAELYTIQITVSRETHDHLRRAQELLRHAIPNGDPAAIVSRALKLLVADLERRRLAATERPRSARGVRGGSRYISASTRRAVWARDAGQCAFVGTDGRCAERGFLELHHKVPFAEGGPATVENMELRCRAHNAYEARLFFGEEMPSCVRESSAEWSAFGEVLA